MRKILLGILIFPAVFLVGSNFWIHYHFQNSKAEIQQKLPKIAIVPGASVSSSGPSPILKKRLDKAVELYKENKIQKILLSGDNGTISYNELKPMLLYMLSNDIKPSDLFVDHAGFRTLDSMVRAKKVFLVEYAYFISQPFHFPRATLLAEYAGIKIFPVPASESQTEFGFGYLHLREIFANTLAVIDVYIFKTGPKFLGPTFPISGSGEPTWKGSLL
jgi:SanA protein